MSGGNQQKVILAREVGRQVRLLLASQPTRGLDVGSIEFVHRRIVEERDRGIAVIIVSSELDEIYALADRIAVMYEGKITGFRPPDRAGNRTRPADGGRRYEKAAAGRPRLPPEGPQPGGRGRGAGGADMTSDPGTSPPDPEPSSQPASRRQSPPDADASSATATSGPPPRDRFRGADRAIISAIVQGSPTVVTILAIFSALVLGGLIIAFSDTTVLHAWNSFFAAPGGRSGGYLAIGSGGLLCPVRGRDRQPAYGCGGLPWRLGWRHLLPALPDHIPGDAADPDRARVALAFRAGLFNIGAASQWIGGAIVVTYLGFAVSLPPVIHVIVCLAGGFAGGAVLGWLVGDLKARTGAHEVIVTIMLNYIMYNVLSYVLGTPAALQQAARPT